MSTKKKENIVSAALKLFAELGFHATSTAKVAKAAGVSEGLIFRHFRNKEGLLSAIMAMGQEKIGGMITDIQALPTPKKRVAAVLSLSFQVSEEDKHFWRLVYSLKWQVQDYNQAIVNPLLDMLTADFAELGYTNSSMEAQTVLLLIDGLAHAIILDKDVDLKSLHQHLLERYRVNSN